MKIYLAGIGHLIEQEPKSQEVLQSKKGNPRLLLSYFQVFDFIHRFNWICSHNKEHGCRKEKIK